MSWFNRFSNLFRSKHVDEELDEELQFHLEARVRDNLHAGMSAEAAQRDARRRFGNATLAKERAHEMNIVISIETIRRDLRYGLRNLCKSPGFTIVALMTLALGVGANTAVFSLINGLLLRPLPVPNAEQLAVLRMDENDAQPEYAFCTPFFRSLEQRHEVFANVFAYNPDTLQVLGKSGNENIQGMLVSGQFFQALETPPLLGRYLTPQDDQSGGNPAGLAVVISEDFWNSWFNHAPDVVGRTMVIANTPFTVVGVMPRRFVGADPTQRPQIFAPLSADPIIDAPRNHIDAGIHAWWIVVGARLQPGISLNAANAQLLTASRPILHEAADDPKFIADDERRQFHFRAEDGSRGFSYVRAVFSRPLLAMFCMCGGILLLACLNLASLLTARAVSRERELATRLALGATRRRLIQQLLTEALLIAALGTIVGLAVVPPVSRSLVAFIPTSAYTTIQLDTSLDSHVFLFAALIAVASSILIGLVPALQATSANLNQQIKEGQQARPAFERRRIFPRALLASEVAVAMILVIGAGLLTTSLLRLFTSGAGFDPKGLVNISFKMDKQSLQGDSLMRLYQQLGEGLSHQPGVKNVSFEFIVPLSHRGWNGRYNTPAGGSHLIYMNAVGPDYFSTMRIPLYTGREFTWNDTRASGLKIILNQAAAKQFFPGRSALGQQVTYPPEKLSYEVVGIVGDTKYLTMQLPAPAAAYVPIQQDEQPKPSLTAVLRADGPQGPLAAVARLLATRLAPGIPAPVMTTMDDVLNKSVSSERMMAWLALFFGGCALLVTAIGLYGTLAYDTARRTSEIGIRMALGARRVGVVALIFRENFLIATLGTTVGLVAALLASRALASFLYETSPRDPSVLACSIALLAFIASAASVLPALRAARIDPVRALRNE